MKRLFILGAISSLLVTMVSLSWAATNLNSSKSNIYRVIYDTAVVSPAQANAIVAELDKIGPVEEAKLKQWLPANFKRHGIQADRVKKIIIRLPNKTRQEITIILLTNPADEAQALAVSDEGVPADKQKKSTN